MEMGTDSELSFNNQFIRITNKSVKTKRKNNQTSVTSRRGYIFAFAWTEIIYAETATSRQVLETIGTNSQSPSRRFWKQRNKNNANCGGLVIVSFRSEVKSSAHGEKIKSLLFINFSNLDEL